MKTYLNVPYHSKDKVKSLGARWDMSAKQWYVPDGVDIFPFLNWVPNMPKLNKKVTRTLKRKRYE